jgi:hypothetical protein
MEVYVGMVQVVKNEVEFLINMLIKSKGIWNGVNGECVFTCKGN